MIFYLVTLFVINKLEIQFLCLIIGYVHVFLNKI
jgi:hypothetical protein